MNCRPDFTYGAVPGPDHTPSAIAAAARAARIALLRDFIDQYEALPPGSAKASLAQRYASAKEELELLAPPPPPILHNRTITVQENVLDKLSDLLEKNKTAVVIASGAIGILLLRKLLK